MGQSNSGHSDHVFDYVIVGAGAARAVLANRLSEDPRNQVLLLEYGGPDWNPAIWVPKGFFFLLQWKRYRYQYPTQPLAPSSRVEVWTRGKVLGGSTVVNGMMWNRGGAADWDGVAARGNPAFSWERVLSAYRAMEDHNLGASDMRGAGGPLGVSVVEEDDEVLHAILAAAQGMGWERVADTNASDGERIGFVPGKAWEGFKYLLTRRGPIATPAFNLVSGFKSSPELNRPDIQGQFVPLAVDPSSPNLKLANYSGVQFVGFQISPTTMSSIHLGGRLPQNAPIIDAHYLEDDGDRKAIAPVLGIARELFAKSPLADYVLEEEVPGRTVSSDDGLQHAINTESSSYHAVGACAMGPNSDDVVDPQLRVRGVDGLRVVDASVLPVQVSGNTAAPVMAVAWLAADLILEDS